MNPNHIAAFRAIEEAQKALRAHDKALARRYAVQAAQLAPELEEAWLMLAALASPRASVAYLEKALQINPKSERAHKGMAWAVKRLREQQTHQTAKIPVSTAAPARIIRQPLPRANARPLPPVKSTALCRAVPCPTPAISHYSCACWPHLSVWQGATPPWLCSTIPLAPAQGGVGWAEVQLEKPTYTLTPTPTFTPNPDQPRPPTRDAHLNRNPNCHSHRDPHCQTPPSPDPKRNAHPNRHVYVPPTSAHRCGPARRALGRNQPHPANALCLGR
jgi:hypothetical protein